MSTTEEMSARDRQQIVLDLVRRHGWNATAFQTLEGGYSYFFHGDACVAYVDTGGAWVVAGSPLVAAEELGTTTGAFLEAARAAGRRAVFFGVESRFLDVSAGIASIQVGAQPVFDPREWPSTLTKHRHLREQLRRARAKGVSVRELAPDELVEPVMRRKIELLVEEWLSTRSLAPMGFLVRVEPFLFPDDRRVFVAERSGTLVAFAGMIPVPARRGWFLEDLLRAQDAPNGTGELLVDRVMTEAARAGATWFTLGIAPLAGDVGRALEIARDALSSLYDFGGLYRYKAKFRPARFDPIFLAYPRSQGAASSIIDALRAFAPGGFVRFGIRTFLRGPSAILRCLTALLVPWIALLALTPTEPWFGHAGAKWAWIGFDGIVFVALCRLLRRPSVTAATVLAVAITGDFVVTFASLAERRLLMGDPRSILVASAACLAPALAATVLWGTRVRIARLRRLQRERTMGDG